jgi:altronate hydrolase
MPVFPLTDKAILLREGDDVAVAKSPLAPGDVLVHQGHELPVLERVPVGHKVAVRAVPQGHPVRKYGHTIGHATAAIRPGEWVHIHNMDAGPLKLAYEFGTEATPVPTYPEAETRTFPGYVRADGRVGTRNYVAVISTVNCSASAANKIARLLVDRRNAGFPNVDGVMAVTHKVGCAMAVGGRDHRVLQRALAGIATHPNVAAYMIVGLGCEVNAASFLLRDMGLAGPVLNVQECGGVQRTVELGAAEGLKLLQVANRCQRKQVPISHLVVGTNCGGSDANSGITANPALGLAGDELVRHGGTWLIGETPETYGAEHLLTRRAASREVAEKLLALMRWWEEYTAALGDRIDNNPAPGNKEGGLTTIYEKSLGAVMKGGNTPLVAVYDYAERIRHRGFCFMDTPGFDPVSVTGLVAGGCSLVAFTTGRGSCLGFQPAPCLKIATNTALYEQMPDDMDINAGVLLEGAPMEDVAAHIFEELLAVAGGKPTKSESQGLGQEEFAPWLCGPVL